MQAPRGSFTWRQVHTCTDELWTATILWCTPLVKCSVHWSGCTEQWTWQYATTRMRWRNTTPTMGWQPTLGPTNTKWTGRPPRQEKWKGTTGIEGYWKPCAFINSNTPPTWTVVWQSIPPGCHCLTNPHALYTFFQTHSSPFIIESRALLSL